MRIAAIEDIMDTICNDCGERISLYSSHVCRKYSDRTDSGWWNACGTYLPQDKEKPKPYDYVKLMNDGIRFRQEFLTKQLSVGVVEEKRNYICPMCRETEDICDCKGYYDRKYMEEKMAGSRVVEAMEKDKFIDGKVTYSGTLNKCSMDLAAIKQLAGVDLGKENSKSVKMISELMPDGSIRSFPMNNWENHPIYLELKNNINVKCEVDNNGKITGTVVSNLYLSAQWFLDFEKRCCLNKGVLSMSSWQSPDFQGLLNFQIQLIEYTTDIPKMIYEVGSDKPFYEQCAVCNQCDERDQYKPKTKNYTCQKCWPR